MRVYSDKGEVKVSQLSSLIGGSKSKQGHQKLIVYVTAAAKSLGLGKGDLIEVTLSKVSEDTIKPIRIVSPTNKFALTDAEKYFIEQYRAIDGKNEQMTEFLLNTA